MRRGTDSEAVAAAERKGARMDDLWAPWGDRDVATREALDAMLAKPHRIIIHDDGGRLTQIWARGNAHVIEIR